MPPSPVVPTYIMFLRPGVGFGLFTATELMPLPLGDNFPSEQCIGTYGGMVCTVKEALHPKYMYNTPGKLTRTTKSIVK